jgi:hypothetical protein
MRNLQDCAKFALYHASYKTLGYVFFGQAQDYMPTNAMLFAWCCGGLRWAGLRTLIEAFGEIQMYGSFRTGGFRIECLVHESRINRIYKRQVFFISAGDSRLVTRSLLVNTRVMQNRKEYKQKPLAHEIFFELD